MKPMSIAPLVVCLLPSAGLSQSVVDPALRNDIAALLRNPRNVYELDHEQNKVIFERMDGVFRGSIDLSKATLKRSSTGGSRYKTLRRTNTPILVEGEKGPGLSSPKPFFTYYDTGSQKRVFRKDLAVPAKQSLGNAAVVALATAFIRSNRLCQTSELDSFGDASVGTLKRQRLEAESKPENGVTVLQRIEFRRKVAGLDVVNSRQVVEIHPETKEILGYKNTNWTPLRESSAKQHAYLTLEEIVGRIDSLIGGPATRLVVTNVHAAMFQNDKFLFPVLVVSAELPRGSSYAYRRKLVVGLVKDIPSDWKPRARKFEPRPIGR
jgi:hypothetical protein